MANKFTEQDFIKKINLFFPDWNFKILSFDGYKQPAEIQCLNCNKIIKLKKASDISRKVNICTCYKKFKDYHEKIRYFGEKCGFQVLEDEKATQKIHIKCLKCGYEMYRSLVSLLNTPEHCDNCNYYRKGIPHYTKEEVQNKLNNSFNNEYELLEYKGVSYPALLKHYNCGYVFKIRELGDLFDGRNRGCPKCYQFKSVGEQRIRNYLDLKNITYIPQKTFSPLNKSKYRFDFFLPDYNLAIEYMGEQHYRDNHFFRDNYESVHRRDEIKREYCKKNNIELLEIKYTQLKKIEAILESRFNDYRNSN